VNDKLGKMKNNVIKAYIKVLRYYYSPKGLRKDMNNLKCGSQPSAQESILGPSIYAERPRRSQMSAGLITESFDGGFSVHGNKSSGSIKADYSLSDYKQFKKTMNHGVSK
jgi:hypothetical protein